MLNTFWKGDMTMKRYICLFVVMTILFAVLSLPISAQNDIISNSESGKDTTVVTDSLSFRLLYDAESKRVRISGTLGGDVFENYRDWKIVAYAVPPGQTEEQVVVDTEVKPLAEVTASINVEFSFKVDSVVDLYSRYAIFLRSPDGEFILTTEAQYPEVASTYKADGDRASYKGISTEIGSISSELSAGTAIIPVYWDKLFSDTSSILFFLAEGKQYFFNKSAIDELDVAIRSMSVSGSKVYLRLLKTPDSTEIGSEYVMPDVYDRETIAKMHAAISFLTERYQSEKDGRISGMILGKGWDQPNKYNYANDVRFDEYVDRCGIYTVIVANAARSIDPSVDIVVPLTADGFTSKKDGGEYFKSFVEQLLSYFDDSFYAGLNCSFILDVAATPLGITNDNASEGVDLKYVDPEGRISAGAQQSFSSYLYRLDEKYVSCPNKYIFSWSPERQLRGNALAAAYAYSYYALLSDKHISCFVLDSAGRGANQHIGDLFHVMKHIDTKDTLSVTKSLAGFFGVSDFSEIFRASVIAECGVKQYYTADPMQSVPGASRGSFFYFDFSQSSLIENWYAGAGCRNIKIDYREDAKKSLLADLVLSGSTKSSELLYIYDYPENMIYTPKLQMRFHVSDTSESSLYEVRFTLENSLGRYESSAIVEGDTPTDISLEISRFVKANETSSIRVSVRNLDGSASECSFWLYDVRGHSDVYSSSQLRDLIIKERDKIRNPDETRADDQLLANLAMAVAIIVAAGLLGMGAFVAFRHDDRSTEE